MNLLDTISDISWYSLVPVVLLFLCGFVLLVAGRRVMRAGFASAGLLLGGVAHLLVNSLKQAREKTGSGLVAVQDWLLWVHVKESALLMSVVYIWVGAIALAFSMDDIQWVTAFFVGYSIDSFVDVFLQRFSERMSAETESIRKKLVGAAPT